MMTPEQIMAANKASVETLFGLTTKAFEVQRSAGAQRFGHGRRHHGVRRWLLPEDIVVTFCRAGGRRDRARER